MPQHRVRACEKGPRIEGIVHSVVIAGAVQVIAARLGNDIDESAQCAPVFGGKGVVDYAKFLGRLLRGSDAWKAGKILSVVGAIHQNLGVEFRLSSKGEARRRCRPYGGVRLFECASAGVFPAWGHAAGKLNEVHKVASDIGQRLNGLLVDHVAHFGF